MKAKIIVNPSSGKQMVQKHLDKFIGNLVLEGILNCIDIAMTHQRYDAMKEAMGIKKGEYDLIIAVGGDGTLNEVVNGVMEGQNHIPVAILPAGTVNDFANWLDIPQDIKGFCQMIRDFKKMKVDVGKAGTRYFINVAAGGLLTDVGYKASSDAKTVLGKFAYFVEGIKEIPKQGFKSILLDIEGKEGHRKEEVLLFIITNTSTAGGLKRIAPKAEIDDGLLDVCIVRKCDIGEVFSLFLRTMRGDHIKHPKVEYMQTAQISLSCAEDMEVGLDLDGEQGGKLPITIEVIPKAIEMIVP